MEGHYANYFEVGQNAYEVVVDFGQFYQGEAEPRKHTRIIIARSYAQTLVDLVIRAIEGREESPESSEEKRSG